MKNIILLLTICILAGLQSHAAKKIKKDRVLATFAVPANKGYAEPFTTGNPGCLFPWDGRKPEEAFPGGEIRKEVWCGIFIRKREVMIFRLLFR